MSAKTINSLPTKVIDGKNPHKVFFKKQPDYKKFHTFGTMCYYKILTPHKKLEPRAHNSVFIGFSSGQKGYKLFDFETNKIVVSREVEFFEDVYPFHQRDGHEDKVDEGTKEVFTIDDIVEPTKYSRFGRLITKLNWTRDYVEFIEENKISPFIPGQNIRIRTASKLQRSSN